MNDIFSTLGAVGQVIGVILCAVIFGLLLYFIIFRIFDRVRKRTDTLLDDFFFEHLRKPSRFLIPLIIVQAALPMVQGQMAELVNAYLTKLIHVLLIGGVAWLLIKLVDVFEQYILSQYEIDARDNLRARKIHTQMGMMKKVITVVIGILGLAIILMSFERFRELGTGLLASAGLAGLIIGFAAQRTLANLLAGIQIAITQPIRIDDVVIVEGEWGRIEEITLTYVVVRIWDLRRLILPISYFIDKPFQNWTRVSADLLGTVFLHVDYTVPIEEVRETLHKILEESDLWDRKVWRLHTTEAGERTVQLRALMSASDSSSAWELRCEVREKLIDWVQTHYPESLPKLRADLTDNRPELHDEE